MKVGIFTFHEANNYGAVLQAYALQTVLSHFGVESEFVSFKKGYSDKKRMSEELDKSMIAFTKRIQEEGKKRSAFFNDFRKTYLRCAAPISRQNANELNEEYDVFISGSDQIWNFDIPETDGRYFLPFADTKKRFSYAASFGGNNIPDKVRDWCVKQLMQFQALSVREESGRKTLKELTGRDSLVCIDPVFLLEREEWEELASKRDDDPYILVHLIQYDKAAVMYVQKLAAKEGLRIQIITSAFMYPCGFYAWNGTDVVNWLALVKNAKYIFTNSFHAMAFSMIFGRPFSIIRLNDNLTGRNCRMEEILKKADLEKCINGELVSISAQDLENRLGQIKQLSYDYLKRVVSE